MQSDHKLTAFIVASLAAAVIGIAWAVAWYNVTTYRALLDGGYTQVQCVGSQQVMWTKPGSPTVAAEAPRAAR